jgi:Protein of unknown function (DUF3833)
MKRIFVTLFTLLAALWLAGCASVDIKDYAADQPKLDLRQYFNGTIDGWGMVQDRSGKVTRRFHVVIEAKWTGDTGVLDESFKWSDGKTEKRIWTITKSGDRYSGTAGDVVGTAAGEAVGNALLWNYVLSLPVDDKTYHVDMDDWMYLIDERTLGNRTKMSKFGVQLAEITIFFRKR